MENSLTFKLENCSESFGTASLFGANQDLGETYNTAQGIAVEVLESSHWHVKLKSLKGIRIKSIYIVKTNTPKPNPIYIVENTIFGRRISTALEYKEVERKDLPYLSHLKGEKGYKIVKDINVNEDVSLEIKLRKLEKITIIIFIEDPIKS